MDTPEFLCVGVLGFVDKFRRAGKREGSFRAHELHLIGLQTWAEGKCVRVTGARLVLLLRGKSR